MDHHRLEFAAPFDYEVCRSHCTQHLNSSKNKDLVGIKYNIEMTGINAPNGTQVTMVTAPNILDMFSNHVMIMYFDFFKRPGSPNQDYFGNGINSIAIARSHWHRRGKNSQTSSKSDINSMDLSDRKISLTWPITSTVLWTQN